MECYFMKYFCNVTDARSCHDQGFVGMRFHGKPIIFHVLSIKCSEFWKRVANIPTSYGLIAWNFYLYEYFEESAEDCVYWT